MFGELLESRAKHQRRGGGAAMSAAMHVAIIGAVAAGTVHGKSAPPEPVRQETIHFAHMQDPPPEPRHMQPQIVAPHVSSSIAVHVVIAPTIVPMHLPDIDSALGRGTDSIIVGAREGRGRGTLGDSLARAMINTGDDRAWDSREIFTHVLTQGTPRYPEVLRSAGVNGRVLIEFMVDTTGRIDMKSVKILQTTHELFSDAVRNVLPNFRFRPAEAGGRKIPVLAQMPFEFSITK